MINRGWLRRLSARKVTGLSGAVAAGLVAGVVGLSSCSSGSASPGVTIVASGTSTTFRTEPVRTTTTTLPAPPDLGGGDDDGSSGGTAGDPADADPNAEQAYEVRRGDYLVGIAQRFDVTAEAIAAYNGWESLQHSLQPGDSIRIPPQDWDPDEAPPGSGSGAASPDGDAAEGACPDGSTQQTYTIRAGDVKGTVARRFDVTVAELDAANAATPFYAGFVIGIEILIPC